MSALSITSTGGIAKDRLGPGPLAVRRAARGEQAGHGPVVVLAGLGGIEATRVITAEHPSVKVIALAMSQDDALITSMVTAGARGYILKDARATELLQAIRVVAAGGAVLGPAALSHVLDQFRRLAGAETVGRTVVMGKREV